MLFEEKKTTFKRAKKPKNKTPGKRHNLALINKLLAGYGLEIDDKMSTVKIKSFRRYLAGAWKGKK